MVHAGPARPRKWRGTDLFRSKSVDLEWIWVLPLGAGRLERPNGHIEQERPARASVAMPRLVSPLTRNAGTKVCAKLAAQRKSLARSCSVPPSGSDHMLSKPVDSSMSSGALWGL